MSKNQPFITVVMLAVCFSMLACSGKKDVAGQESSTHTDSTAENENWVEMDEFHLIMAEAFHPYKEDSTDLGPAKANAAALAAAAVKWSEAPLPAKMNNDHVKAKLQQLKTDANAFAEVVKSGDDKAIGESLTRLHDLFHEIQEAWYGGGEHHHH